MPLEGRGGDVPDLGFARESVSRGASCSSCALEDGLSEVVVVAVGSESAFAFLFLPPLAFFKACVKARDFRVSMRLKTKDLSVSVLGRIGTMSRCSYVVAHWTHLPSPFISLMASWEKTWPQGTM